MMMLIEKALTRLGQNNSELARITGCLECCSSRRR